MEEEITEYLSTKFKKWLFRPTGCVYHLKLYRKCG